MRKTFAQVLNEAKIDINIEYMRLYQLFYEEPSIWQGRNWTPSEFINLSFQKFPNEIRQNAISFDDFNQVHNFNFEKNFNNIDVNAFISFCEYTLNLLYIAQKENLDAETDSSINRINNQIAYVIEKIGYEQIKDDVGFISFVEKSPAVSAVSEILPTPTDYKVIFYNHHSMKGNLEGKKTILKQIADLLEPRRNELEKINKDLANNIFFAFNNCDIRHNNINANGKYYKKYIAELKPESLESIYDELYQMCLLGFLELDNKARILCFENLKECINQTK